MGTYCVPATTLLLLMLGRTLSEHHCHCKDSVQNIKRVSLHGNVTVPCPNFTAPEMKFKLFKGSSEIATNVANKSAANDLNESGGQIALSVNMVNNRTNFVLNGVTMDYTGLYTCEAEILYPPPFGIVLEKPRALVIVDEPQSHVVRRSEVPLWVALGVLTAYSVIITYIALALRSHVRRKDVTRHDYINMKPRARRQKQGILHPPRLSWYTDPASPSCNKHPS
ncbi:T-cell-specific surface glycoprotein CD28 [Brachyhypopomus gauderio]|uniref:T-cell-specific surface glycoprotein CD28 n=1 Tax=Brachyhypopomus gauderio TaxID=698409 RepID=UPI00404190EF